MDTFDTRIIEIADFKSLIKSYPWYILWRLNATWYNFSTLGFGAIAFLFQKITGNSQQKTQIECMCLYFFGMNLRRSCSASLVGSVETVESVISQTMLQSFYYVLVCKAAPKVFYDFGCYDATYKCPLLLFSPSLMMCSALSFHWLPIFSKLFYCPCYPGHSPVLLHIVYCHVHKWWHRQRMKDRNMHWSQRLGRSC